MTILHDECKPMTDNPKPSDAVVELMARALAEADHSYRVRPADFRYKHAKAILSALSDAGLAVLPLEATTEIEGAMADAYWKMTPKPLKAAWRAGAAAFHPSQLETRR